MHLISLKGITQELRNYMQLVVISLRMEYFVRIVLLACILILLEPNMVQSLPEACTVGRPEPPSICFKRVKGEEVYLICKPGTETRDEHGNWQERFMVEIFDSSKVLFYNHTNETPDFVIKGLQHMQLYQANVYAIAGKLDKECLSHPYTIEGIRLFRENELVKPSTPSIQGSLPTLKETDKKSYSFNCLVAGGIPAPRLLWFIGDDQLTEGLGTMKESLNGSSTIYSLELRNQTFAVQDARKQLRCVVDHEALTGRDKNEAELPIVMHYSPRIITSWASKAELNDTIVLKTDLKKEEVKFVVLGNPAPKVVWIVEGTAINPGKEHGPYTALPLQLNPYDDRNIITMRINATEAQEKVEFQIQIENSEGSRKYNVTVLSSDKE